MPGFMKLGFENRRISSRSTPLNGDGVPNMIQSRNDLGFYLSADKYILGIKRSRPSYFDEIWKYQIALRKAEYFLNTEQTLFSRLLARYHMVRKYKLGMKLGFDIEPNVFGAGLRINHFGSLIINGNAKIGMWCDIHQGVVIGTDNSPGDENLVPTIGDNVWIGPGAKIFGDIKIGSNVVIGANSIVNKSFPSNTTIAGIPAKIIKDTGTEKINVAASQMRTDDFFVQNPQWNQYKQTVATY